MVSQAYDSQRENPSHEISPSVLIVEGAFADFDNHSDKEQAQKSRRCREVGTGANSGRRRNHCC